MEGKTLGVTHAGTGKSQFASFRNTELAIKGLQNAEGAAAGLITALFGNNAGKKVRKSVVMFCIPCINQMDKMYSTTSKCTWFYECNFTAQWSATCPKTLKMATDWDEKSTIITKCADFIPTYTYGS